MSSDRSLSFAGFVPPMSVCMNQMRVTWARSVCWYFDTGRIVLLADSLWLSAGAAALPSTISVSCLNPAADQYQPSYNAIVMSPARICAGQARLPPPRVRARSSRMKSSNEISSRCQSRRIQLLLSQYRRGSAPPPSRAFTRFCSARRSPHEAPRIRRWPLECYSGTSEKPFPTPSEVQAL